MTTKKIMIAIATFAASTTLFSQGTIPNQDFEGWVSSYKPKNWQTTTQMLPPGYVTCYRTSSSYSGAYAVKLTTIDLDGLPVPGVITLGDLGIGYTAGGIGFSDRPEALKGYLMHPTQGDEVRVIVQFYRDGQEIGTGYWSTTDSIPGYQEFSASISFNSTLEPDTMNITILTDPEHPGSSMYIDGLEFTYATTGIGSRPGTGALRIYPNPCSDRLHIEVPGEGILETFIYTADGQRIAGFEKESAHSMDVSGLSPGTYVVLARTPVGIFREKLIRP